MSSTDSGSAPHDATIHVLQALRAGPNKRQLRVHRVNASAYELRVRLLELGLIPGAIFEASLRGAHVVIKLRGDLIILRSAEAQQIEVSTSITHPSQHTHETRVKLGEDSVLLRSAEAQQIEASTSMTHLSQRTHKAKDEHI